MNKTEYLVRLKSGLSRLPQGEIDGVMEYYEEYFNEAGEENESAVIEELGEPKEVAGRVIAEMAIRYMKETPDSIKKGFGSLKITILALCTAPITVPVAFALLAAAASVALAGLMAYACIWILVLSMGFAGIGSLVGAVSLLSAEAASSLAILGLACICFAIGIWAAYAGVKSGRWLFKRITSLFSKLIKRGVKK